MSFSITPEIIAGLAEKSTQNLRALSDVFCADMENKVAIVTGGATGLGYNIVNRLAEAGVKVIIASRNEERGKKAECEFRSKGYEVLWKQTDVTKISDCYAAVDFAVSKYGKIDIVVANAAIWNMYSFLDMPEEVFDNVLNTNIKGEYFIAQAAARVMVQQKIKGKIVFISSVAYKGADCPGVAMMTHYNASKGAVVSMTKGIAKELHQYGISVNCVAPGGMFTRGALMNGGEAGTFYGKEVMEDRGKYGRNTPSAMNPDDVALSIFALCTAMSNYMVGETIDVDGGAMWSYQQRPWSYTVEGCIPGPQAKE